MSLYTDFKSAEAFLVRLEAQAIGWPIILYMLGAMVLCTVVLKFVQFRYFARAWNAVIAPDKGGDAASIDMTPFQAFLNILSINLGNGSIAGMATAICLGGPGAGLWVLIIGLLCMSVRFAEVFLSAHAAKTVTAEQTKAGLGGPMLYLQSVVGGRVLALLYAVFGLFFGLSMENAMQANSMALALKTTWGVAPLYIAAFLFVFMLYVVFGGAHRIAKLAEAIVPLKVGVFFVSVFIVLAYHWREIFPSLMLMSKAAFAPVALVGGVIGFSVQQALRYGIVRSVMATESGLGTAGLFFTATGSKQPVDDGLMGMVASFVGTLVCFLVALCIMVSGVWNCGLTSTPLTIAAYNTVFGVYGGWVVSFLSLTFGFGVSISAAYFTRSFWMYLTGGKFATAFALVYALCAFAGAVFEVKLVWALGGLFTVGLLLINLFGITYKLPLIKRELDIFDATH